MFFVFHCSLSGQQLRRATGHKSKSQVSKHNNKLVTEFRQLERVGLLFVESESADQYPTLGTVWKSKLTRNYRGSVCQCSPASIFMSTVVGSLTATGVQSYKNEDKTSF